MDSYKIDLVKGAEREARKINKQDLKRILIAIRALKENPFPHGSKKLKGTENKYRIRVGDYRIIYDVDTQNYLVTVFHIRHRRDAY